VLVSETDPDGAGDTASEAARQLREHHIVPLLYGIGQPTRLRLRQGFAAVIAPDAGVDQLDRNIRLLVGHVQTWNPRAAQQAAVVADSSRAISGARVLVVEDRLVNQTVIRKQLKQLGINCTLAANGLRALETLVRQPFDLILCDCSMPEMNGYDFTRVLRAREASVGDGRRLPVIALTANAFREDAEKCLEAGMDDFVSKPVTINRLAAVLVRWLTKPVAGAAAQSHTPSAGAARMIDLDELAEILGTNEPDALNQVLEDFLAAMETTLLEVEAAVAGGNPTGIRAAAHGAKGEARCAAATGLADLYEELGRTAADREPAVSKRLLAAAAAEVRRVEGFIRQRLEVHAS
jgi:CheY-like chemotaxis protein